MRADLIEVFEILRGFFQVVRDDGRKGHSFKLFKRRYRLDVGRFKFANPVCEEWNGLDDDVVAVGSVNARITRIHPCRHNCHGWPSAGEKSLKLINTPSHSPNDGQASPFLNFIPLIFLSSSLVPSYALYFLITVLYMHHNSSISDLSFCSCKPGYMHLRGSLIITRGT